MTGHKITDCARCGGNHWGIVWNKFKNPIELGDRLITHWKMCPETNEPILMYFVDGTALDR